MSQRDPRRSEGGGALNEDALFSLRGPEWTPTPQMGGVASLSASNGSLFVGTTNGMIVRLGVVSGEYEELELPSSQRGVPAHALFADPHSAVALIAALPSAENYYFFKGKQRHLAKFKGVRVTAVAWLKPDLAKPDVREIIIGDAKGVLYEAVVEPARTKSFRQIHLLSPPSPICGLHCEMFPPSASDDKRMLLLVSTLERYHEFVGGPTLDALLAEPTSAGSELAGSIAPAAGGGGGAKLPTGSLVVYRRPNGAAAAFACMAAGRLLHASLLLSPQPGSVVFDADALRFPTVDLSPAEAAAGTNAMSAGDGASGASSAGAPTAIALTEFHFVLLYPSCVLAVSRLNLKVACRALPPRGWTSGTPLLGLTQDVNKGALWAWGAAGLLRVRVVREERHVWRLHLEAKQFDAALSYCSPTELMQRDAVLTAQADFVFKEGRFELAATQYAKTKQSVEDVAMRFVTASQSGALKTFLLHKLDSIDEADAAQLTMLCTWLTEIYLHALSSASDAATQTAVTREFRDFLTDKRRHLHRPTTYSLIAAQGRVEELLHFASLCGDWERALSLHVQQRQPEEALALLSALLRGDLRTEGGGLDARASAEWEVEAEALLEKFSPQLILMAPAQLVDVWMQAPYLEPSKLLPAIMSYEQRYEQGAEAVRARAESDEAGALGGHGKLMHQGIRYLTHCIDVMGCDHQAVCNCLTLLHAKHSPDEVLHGYLSGIPPNAGGLEAQPATGDAGGADGLSIRAAAEDAAAAAASLGMGLVAFDTAYDPQYALRVCSECGRHEGMVVIYQRRGMCTEAVDLALAHGRLDLAKKSADSVQHNSAEERALRKTLWLQIARFVINGGGDKWGDVAAGDESKRVTDALALVSESSVQGEAPLLQLEDLLTLFPDFTLIDDFKEPVCASLAGYGERMEELRNEMDEAAAASATLRDEIAQLEGREIALPPDKCCDIAELASLEVPTCGGQPVAGVRHVSYPCGHAFRLSCLLATLKEQAVSSDEADLVAECPLCGELMVESVSRPFIDAGEAALQAGWAISADPLSTLQTGGPPASAAGARGVGGEAAAKDSKGYLDFKF